MAGGGESVISTLGAVILSMCRPVSAFPSGSGGVAFYDSGNSATMPQCMQIASRQVALDLQGHCSV